jgi:ribose transport system ATP-binding protein
MTAPLLELIDIRKTYPGVVALDAVSLSVARGEVVGLVGENGAGKSTLMKVLGGVIEPDSGTIRTEGVERRALSVKDALAAGIAFVHQELNLFENLDVAANVYIGREALTGGWLKLVNNKALHERVRPFLDRLGCDFGADAVVEHLSLAQRQLVEIAKALSLDARLVIMDEPTSSLTITETERLLRVIAALKTDGVSVIFISHRLAEVERCADRVVVLRDGRVAGRLERSQIDHAAMIRLMIGRELKGNYIAPARPSGAEALQLRDVRTSSHPDQSVDLAVRQGEILGLAGLVGAGRTELARLVFGADRRSGGTISLAGRRLAVASPRDAIRAGICLLTEDRKAQGLLLGRSALENFALPNLGRFSRRGWLRLGAERAAFARHVAALGLRIAGPRQTAGQLSGGNQQKLLIARWLESASEVVIFDEPTRGVDVGARYEIYQLIHELARQGKAIVIISSELPEVLGVCDRILVMREGRVSGEITDVAGATQERLLELAVA